MNLAEQMKYPLAEAEQVERELAELLFGNHMVAGSPEQGERDCTRAMELATGITIPEKMLLIALAVNEAQAFSLDYERLNHQTLMTEKELKKAAGSLLQKQFISVVDGGLAITLKEARP